MKDEFNTPSYPKDDPRIVTIPAHTAHGFDWMSYRDDGMQGNLKGLSEADIQRQYFYDRQVPEQTIAFTSWDDLPYGMEQDTKALLRRTMAQQDRQAIEENRHLVDGRIPLIRPLRFRNSK
jgi:hypothetical protein